MKTHEYADIFPLMDKKEFEDLKRDIKNNGLMEAVITLDNKILDGRNRYNACKEVGVKCRFEEYDGSEPLQFVMSTNLQRRNLNQSQRAMVGRRWKIHYAKYAKQRMLAGKKVDPREPVPEGKASDQAGEIAGVSGRYIDMTEEVIAKKPEMEASIMSGEKKIKEVLREIKEEEQEKKIEELIPEKKITGIYDIIVIDPPWNYGREYDPDNSRVASPYPEMGYNKLKEIKIPIEKDGILFLWTTHQFIWEAKQLLNDWGFQYKAILVWDKEKMGMGSWLRMQCEFCLIAIKGKPLWKPKDIRDIIREPRTSHSTKPNLFYKIIDENFKGRKLDYFARKKREGWDVYGDEIK